MMMILYVVKLKERELMMMYNNYEILEEKVLKKDVNLFPQ